MLVSALQYRQRRAAKIPVTDITVHSVSLSPDGETFIEAEVASQSHGDPYHCILEMNGRLDWASCSCPDFRNPELSQGHPAALPLKEGVRVCKHVLAVERLLS